MVRSEKERDRQKKKHFKKERYPNILPLPSLKLGPLRDLMRESEDNEQDTFTAVKCPPTKAQCPQSPKCLIQRQVYTLSGTLPSFLLMACCEIAHS